MQAMSCYQMSQYTVIDISHSPATSLIDLMSPMHLMMSATVKIVEPISESKNSEFRTQYPDWKYFLAEIRQYVGQDNVPLPFMISWFTSNTDVQYQIVIEYTPGKHYENCSKNTGRSTDGCHFRLYVSIIRIEWKSNRGRYYSLKRTDWLNNRLWYHSFIELQPVIRFHCGQCLSTLNSCEKTCCHKQDGITMQKIRHVRH